VVETGTGKPRSEPLAHLEQVEAAAFTADGRSLWTAAVKQKGGEGEMRRWDLASLRAEGEPYPFRSQTSYRSPVTFAPGASHAVVISSEVGGRSAEARLWDLAAGTSQVLEGHEQPDEPLFDRAGHRLVTTGRVGREERVVRIREVPGGRLLQTIRLGGNVADPAQLSPDGTVLKTAELIDGSPNRWQFRFWDLVTGQALGEPLRQGTPYRFGPDGRTVWLAAGRGMKLYDIASGQALASFDDPSAGDGGFRPGYPYGKGLLTLVPEEPLQLLDTVHGEDVGAPLALEGKFRLVRFHPDGKMLWTAAGKVVQRWDSAAGRQLGAPLTHDGEVVRIDFSSSGKTALTVNRAPDSKAETLRLWDALTGQPLGEPQAFSGRLVTVTFRPGAESVLTRAQETEIGVRELFTGRPLARALPLELEDDFRWPPTFCCSPDGKTMVTLGRFGIKPEPSYRWDLETGERTTLPDVAGGPQGYFISTAAEVTPQPHDLPSWMKLLATSSDGRFYLVSRTGYEVRVMDPDSGAAIGVPLPLPGLPGVVDTRLKEPFGEARQPVSCPCSPDGRVVVTGSDRGVQRWDVSTGKTLGDLLPHPGLTRWLFSPDGQAIITTGVNAKSKQGEVRVWGTATGAPLGTHTCPGAVHDMIFAPDGRLLILAGTEAYLWSWAAGGDVLGPLTHPAHAARPVLVPGERCWQRSASPPRTPRAGARCGCGRRSRGGCWPARCQPARA
jgi:WD40 repeat protein